MYILATNMWFTKLIRQFFFWLDKIVFNFISEIYDILISIARTSVFTQTDFADISDRIYKLLAIFMVFKVTLSLISYVVNPDDFSDKSKGVSKLGLNIVISMALLILTPYIFNYAYQIQTILLEDNSLGTLIFGGDEEKQSFFNTAGDKIAYTTMTPFFSPNVSLNDDMYKCLTLTTGDPGSEVTFNPECSTALEALTTDNDFFKIETLENYKAGVEHGNLGLMFRDDLVVATNSENKDFIMEYKFVFSTVVGVIIVLLLITFCMDIAVRSIKLACLQLVAPIPIISYVDPKSGKDGMFKKWYEMCFKTYLSLFVRLLALYFAVFIISKIADGRLVDIIDGSYIRNPIIYVFIIIGALMFAKQLPKMLEGLGIKLDGDGKFFLNPFKKFEEGALGGKRITGAVGGAVAGSARGRLVSGSLRGFVSNKGFKGAFDKQADINRKIGDARINGAGFFGSRFAGVASAFGMENIDLENKLKRLNEDKHAIELAERGMDAKIQQLENEKKRYQDLLKPNQQKAQTLKTISDSGKALVDFSKAEITAGKAGVISTKSKFLHNTHAYLEKMQNQKATEEFTYYAKVDKNGKPALEKRTVKAGDTITSLMATEAEEAIGLYENKIGAMEHLEVRLKGKEGKKAIETVDAQGLVDYERDSSDNIVYVDMSDSEKQNYDSSHSDFDAKYSNYEETAKANGESAKTTASEIKTQSDILASESEKITAKNAEHNKKIADIETKQSEFREKEKFKYKGEEMTIAEAKRRIGELEKEIKDIQETRKTNVEAYKNRRIGGGS